MQQTKEEFIYLFKPETLLKMSFFVLIIVGLVSVGGSFYSGT